ncbi:DUF4148 domain-containing protein [Paraburkholderia sp. GAS334]|uniref:DUF4148 domain-containing protein n=1 Tax=Paraburkholderia sp. GAS334 TaxID=3035131 RepID=UPI003D22EDB4
MNHVSKLVVISALIGSPIASHAIDVASKTRSKVREELIAAEISGQIPFSKTYYPDSQPDRALIYAARKGESASSFGPPAAGVSETGVRTGATGAGKPGIGDNLYHGH